MAFAGLVLVSDSPAQTLLVLDEVPTTADWQGWWQGAIGFVPGVSMTAKPTVQRATKSPAGGLGVGDYVLELTGSAPGTVTPYLASHAENWAASSFAYPDGASATENGKFPVAGVPTGAFSGVRSIPFHMSTANPQFELRLTSAADFTLTHVTIRRAGATTTTTTVPAGLGAEFFNEVPAAAQTAWHLWWGTVPALSFGGNTSMTVNTNVERAEKHLVLPQGAYVLELEGPDAAGVTVRPFFQTRNAAWNIFKPTEAGVATNGELGAKPWTGVRSWPITMTGDGTDFNLRLIGSAEFMVTRVIIRAAPTVTATTTTTTLPVATTSSSTTLQPLPEAGVLWSDAPVAKPAGQDGWHPWWPGSNLAAPSGIRVADNAERDVAAVNMTAGSYSLELLGDPEPGVVVVPHFATMTAWANEKTANGAVNHGQMGSRSWTSTRSIGVLWSPITVSADNAQLALRLTSSGPFTLTGIKLRRVPSAAMSFGVANAPTAVLPGQVVPITLTDWIAGHDVLEVVASDAAVTFDSAVTMSPAADTINFSRTRPGTYTVRLVRDGIVTSSTTVTVTPVPTISVASPSGLVAGEGVPVTVTNPSPFDTVEIVNTAGAVVGSYSASTSLSVVAPPAESYSARIKRGGVVVGAAAGFTVTATPSLSLSSAAGLMEGFPIDVGVNGGELASGDRIRLDTIGQSDDCVTCPFLPAGRSTTFQNTPKAGTYQARLLRRGHTIALKTFTTVTLPKATIGLWGLKLAIPPAAGCRALWAKPDLSDWADTWSPTYSLPSSACPVDLSRPISRYYNLEYQYLYVSATGITPTATDYIQVGPDNGLRRPVTTAVGISEWFSPWAPQLHLVPGMNAVPFTYHRYIGGIDTVVGELLTLWIETVPSTASTVCVMNSEQALTMINNLRPPDDNLTVLPENNFTTVGSCNNPTFLWVDQNGAYIPGQLNADGTPTPAALQGSNTPRNPNGPPATIIAPTPVGTHFFEDGVETPLTSAIETNGLLNCVVRGPGTTVVLGTANCLKAIPIKAEDDLGWKLLVQDEPTMSDACLARNGDYIQISADCSGDSTFTDFSHVGEAFALSSLGDPSKCLTVEGGTLLAFRTCTLSVSQLWFDDAALAGGGAIVTVEFCAATAGAGCVAAAAALFGTALIGTTLYVDRTHPTFFSPGHAAVYAQLNQGVRSFEVMMWIFHRNRPRVAGGTYGQTKGQGMEGHHIVSYTAMPPNRPNGCGKDSQPAVRMDKSDHLGTASNGSSQAAKNFQDVQRSLVNQGKFEEAFNRGVADVLLLPAWRLYYSGLQLALEEAKRYILRCGGGDVNKFVKLPDIS